MFPGCVNPFFCEDLPAAVFIHHGLCLETLCKTIFAFSAFDVTSGSGAIYRAAHGAARTVMIVAAIITVVVVVVAVIAPVSITVGMVHACIKTGVVPRPERAAPISPKTVIIKWMKWSVPGVCVPVPAAIA